MSLASLSKTAKFKKRNLTLREQAVHVGQKFHCLECDHQATRKGDLITHQRSLHRGQKFQCPKCGHKAGWKGDLEFIRGLFTWD